MIVSEAESAKRALEALRSSHAQGQPYDRAVLDLMMPEMDGFQLATQIKADPAIASVGLILLPSFGQRGEGERAQSAGIAAYLQKPVRQSQLYNCLTRVMAELPGSRPVAVPRLVTRHSLRELSFESSRKQLLSETRILIAEDNLINQKVALGQLQNLGYQAEAVSNGRLVLEAMERNDFDIILMDCEMPEMDGFQATAEIRRREGAIRRTTIIAMTANAIDGDSERCLVSGMDDYLSKPVKSDVLHRKLQQWIKPTGADPSRQRLRIDEKPGNNGASSSIDLAALAGLRVLQQSGEPDFVTEMIDLFLNDTTSQLEILRRAISTKDVPEIRRIAHLMKGSTANLGATRMEALYQELETEEFGVPDNGDDGRTLMIKLDNEFQRVSHALKAQRSELEG